MVLDNRTRYEIFDKEIAANLYTANNLNILIWLAVYTEPLF